MSTTGNNINARLALLSAILTMSFLTPLRTRIQTVKAQIQYLNTKRSGALSEGVVIDLIIAFLLVAILFPIAQAQIVSATTTLWNSSVVTMFAVLLPILVIIAIVYHFLKA